jgi:hypothetical protein
MVYPPGQGKSGEYLMDLWRRYLERLAGSEGDVSAQILVASYHAVELLGFLSLSLDRERKLSSTIEARIEFFREGARQAEIFPDCLVNATFSIYNHMNTLCHQFTSGSDSAESLIQSVDSLVHSRVQEASQLERSAAALRASFPLLTIMTMVLGEGTSAAGAIRRVEERFAAASARAGTDLDHLINALYRMVEMMQLLVTLSDVELMDQVQQIATVFKEEDQTRDLQLKLRNGFCRFFELGHLLTNHLDAVLP